MRKKARLCDSPKVEYNGDDLISPLPEEILVSIVSRLTLKEAVASGILSRRWRNLWTSVTGLDFSSDAALGRIVLGPRSRSIERAKYINWVNRIIRQHNGPALDAFKICFDLDKTSRCAIDNWIKFSVAKKVQKLELDLLEYGNKIRQSMRCYTFPLKFFNQCKASSGRQSNLATFNGLRSLRVLTLRCVNVSDQAFKFLLLNCPLLEFLSVHGSGDMVNVKVTGQSLKLNYLEIVFCLGIKTIEIRDTNLASFCYLGPVVNFIIENVPMLDEISVGVGRTGIENNVFGQFAYCFNQLEILTLVIYRPQEDMKISDIPELPKLKELILKIGAWNDDCLLEFTSLMKGCPNVERFVLQLIWLKPMKRRRKMHQHEQFPHQSLKVVEIFGYFGRASDAELALYFIQNAPLLQKLLIDPRNQILDPSSLTEEQIRTEEAARKHARQQLQSKVPPAVELVIY